MSNQSQHEALTEWTPQRAADLDLAPLSLSPVGGVSSIAGLSATPGPNAVTREPFPVYEDVWWEERDEDEPEVQPNPPPVLPVCESEADDGSDAESFFGPEEPLPDLDTLLLDATRAEAEFENYGRVRNQLRPMYNISREEEIAEEPFDKTWKDCHRKAMIIASFLERHERDERYDTILRKLRRIDQDQITRNPGLHELYAYLEAVGRDAVEDTSQEGNASQGKQPVGQSGMQRPRQASVNTMDRRRASVQSRASYPAGEATLLTFGEQEFDSEAEEVLSDFKHYHTRSKFKMAVRSPGKRKKDNQSLKSLQERLNKCAITISQKYGYQEAMKFTLRAQRYQRDKGKPPSRMLKSWTIPSSLDDEFQQLRLLRNTMASAHLISGLCDRRNLNIPEVGVYAQNLLDCAQWSPVTRKHDQRTKRFLEGRQYRVWTRARKDADEFRIMIEKKFGVPDTAANVLNDTMLLMSEYIQTRFVEQVCIAHSFSEAQMHVTTSLKSIKGDVKDIGKAEKLAEGLFEKWTRSIGREGSLFPSFQVAEMSPKPAVPSPNAFRRVPGIPAIRNTPW